MAPPAGGQPPPTMTSWDAMEGLEKQYGADCVLPCSSFSLNDASSQNPRSEGEGTPARPALPPERSIPSDVRAPSIMGQPRPLQPPAGFLGVGGHDPKTLYRHPGLTGYYNMPPLPEFGQPPELLRLANPPPLGHVRPPGFSGPSNGPPPLLPGNSFSTTTIPPPRSSPQLHTWSTRISCQAPQPSPQTSGPEITESLTNSSGDIPPELPPSVEAAYRKKCIQLKQRMNEVEETNDAQRQRLVRLHRSIQKLRLERAFLLEQLAKRTSTNVEDSEGSPSPPPTPKEKPLRTKRGHRRPDFLTTDLNDNRPISAFAQQSPSSDAFSHTHPDALRNSTPQSQAQPSKRHLPSNGTHVTPTANSTSTQSRLRPPKVAFDLYIQETRPALEAAHSQEILAGNFDVDKALAENWRSLADPLKSDYLARMDQLKKDAEVEKETSSVGPRQTVFDAGTRHGGSFEDVEMGDDVDVDDAGTPSAASGGGGFTAVNRN